MLTLPAHVYAGSAVRLCALKGEFGPGFEVGAPPRSLRSNRAERDENQARGRGGVSSGGKETPKRKLVFSQNVTRTEPRGPSFPKVVCGRNAPGVALEQHGKAEREGSVWCDRE